ncbi:hypothetical protein J2R99_000400 [Rhodopseudomonas julia]|uniref:Secreted protein n=1 Tax=Rhodopseudomonas julia TaxID=200617 RepID=A0ABU0C214_9BRAD|nr:DUF5330 domain-containing protein [Rhodopseudomonas julia]MDQ0324551.1 hypothetical protein [Rhodopseudomonas julia]
MFLFRSIFWLTALILVLPPSPDGGPPPRVTLLESALAFQVLAKDVSGVCDRHPEACATSRETFTLLSRKIATGRDMASAALSASTGGNDDGDVDHGSLNASDLSVPWSGRGAPPIEAIPTSASLPVSQPPEDAIEAQAKETSDARLDSTQTASSDDGSKSARRIDIALPQPRPRLL